MDTIYLGTWQFESMPARHAASLVLAAKDAGINHFDTAAVYAGGGAEYVLGATTEATDHIVTKVPALNKHADHIRDAYPAGHVHASVTASARRLGRFPDTVLLHNWAPTWETGTDQLSHVEAMRSELPDAVSLFGISLPNGYDGALETSPALDSFEVVELPYNIHSPLLSLDRIEALAAHRQVLVRSILRKGADKTAVAAKMQSVINTGADLVIGASDPHQIQQWKEYVQ